MFGILMEVLTYNQYKKRKDIFHLFITAFLEPIIFHPVVVWSAVMGNIDYLLKKNSWGEMTREGLGSTFPKQVLEGYEHKKANAIHIADTSILSIPVVLPTVPLKAIDNAKLFAHNPAGVQHRITNNEGGKAQNIISA